MYLSAIDYISTKALLFWDFDGVIKESVAVKADAFESLFIKYGPEVSDKIRKHHEGNSGVSRFDKIPIYLAWAGQPVNKDQVKKYCDQFSKLTLQKVIESPWVEGVREYLVNNYKKQYFVLISATPQNEIDAIVKRLEIDGCFHRVYGAPNGKSESIAEILEQLNISREHALMIGDSESDLAAARHNSIEFLLRRTKINKELQATHEGLIFDGLTR